MEEDTPTPESKQTKRTFLAKSFIESLVLGRWVFGGGMPLERIERTRKAIFPELYIEDLPIRRPRAIIPEDELVMTGEKNVLLREVERRAEKFSWVSLHAIQKFCSAYQLDTPIHPPEIGYPLSFASWYLTTPHAENDMRNPESFLPWVTGDIFRYEDPSVVETTFESTVDIPEKEKMFKLAREILYSMVLVDPSRVERIILGSKNVTKEGIVEWEQRHGTSVDDFRAFVHEIVHATIPTFRKIYPETPGKFILDLKVGTLPILLAFRTTWSEIIGNNLPFFQKRFFSVPGDELFDMLRSDPQNNFHRVIDECIAMLCTDLLLPSRSEDRITKWPQDVVNGVAITWNFIHRGNSSMLQPMLLNEIRDLRVKILGIFQENQSVAPPPSKV